jgi:hypothetical protein
MEEAVRVGEATAVARVAETEVGMVAAREVAQGTQMVAT